MINTSFTSAPSLEQAQELISQLKVALKSMILRYVDSDEEDLAFGYLYDEIISLGHFLEENLSWAMEVYGKEELQGKLDEYLK